HKGKHVMNVRLLTWEAIPSDYQEILSQDYDDALKRSPQEPDRH
ncbi:DNA-binding protein, partial [Enterococcus faecium]|nr:DNA-binding protein [Enterococcus faecium]